MNSVLDFFKNIKKEMGYDLSLKELIEELVMGNLNEDCNIESMIPSDLLSLAKIMKKYNYKHIKLEHDKVSNKIMGVFELNGEVYYAETPVKKTIRLAKAEKKIIEIMEYS